jgi:sortase A
MGTWRPVTLAISDRWGPLPPHADPPPRRALRWMERALLTIAVVCLGYYGYVSAETALYQAFEERELDRILASVEVPGAAPTPLPAPLPAPRTRPAPGSTIGRIEIPRLGVSAVVRSGSDARTLRLAVGHIPGTSVPGEAGNVGLAAHRDTFFRRLRDIRPDDEIIVTTPDGTFRYSVETTHVVKPTDVWVLNPTEQPALTLVTCYPFTYVGSAPQRFVVRAPLQADRQATNNR